MGKDIMNDIDPNSAYSTINSPETRLIDTKTRITLGGERQGGEQLLDLDQVVPLVDSEEFERQTGFRGALVAEVAIGKMTYGIVDTREHTLDENGQFSKDTVWHGGNVGQSATSPILFVQLEKQEDGTYGVANGRNGYKCSKGIRPTPGGLYIGRNADKLIDRGFSFDEYASAGHAVIATTPDYKNLRITDTKSTNGTRLTLASQEQQVEQTVPEPDIIDTEQVRTLGGGILESKGPEKLRPVDVGFAEIPLKGEDTVLVDVDRQLFGIFDGVGKAAGSGAQASSETSKIVSDAFMQTQATQVEAVLENLKAALLRADKTVSEGMTTATVVKIHQDQEGKRLAVWASVGDSRLYVYNRGYDHLVQVTKDEILSPVSPNVITNCVGTGEMEIAQAGYFELGDDDELMLCSDGITGDYPAEILSNEEIKSTLRTPEPALTTAWGLANIARKRDDKSVIVVK